MYKQHAERFAAKVEKMEKELRGPAPAGAEESFKHFLTEAEAAPADPFLEELQKLTGSDSVPEMIARFKQNAGLS